MKALIISSFSTNSIIELVEKTLIPTTSDWVRIVGGSVIIISNTLLRKLSFTSNWTHGAGLLEFGDVTSDFDVEFRFRANSSNSSQDMFFGVQEAIVFGDYRDYKYAFRQRQNVYYIYYDGNLILTYSGAPSTSRLMRIQRIGSTVKYFINDVEEYVVTDQEINPVTFQGSILKAMDIFVNRITYLG